MPDVVDAATCSQMMSGIRGKNTKPEMLLRRGLYARGLRYRLHVKDLPGSPDLVVPAGKAVLFAHGCFWQGHDCHLFRMPGSRPDFWRTKIKRNREVDRCTVEALREAGWRVGAVWECALKGRTRLYLNVVLDVCAAWTREGGNMLEIRGETNE